MRNAYSYRSHEEKCQKRSLALDLCSAPFPDDDQFPPPSAIHRLPLSGHSSRAHPHPRRLIKGEDSPSGADGAEETDEQPLQDVFQTDAVSAVKRPDSTHSGADREGRQGLFMGPIDR